MLRLGLLAAGHAAAADDDGVAAAGLSCWRVLLRSGVSLRCADASAKGATGEKVSNTKSGGSSRG